MFMSKVKTSHQAAEKDAPISFGPVIHNEDQFEILGEIASGPSATVFEAYDLKNKRYVAIKQPHTEFQDEQSLSEYWREAEFLRDHPHPHLVTIYSVDPQRGWLVMERMQGSLADEIQLGPLDSSDVRRVLSETLAALQFLHQHDKIHGRISPASLLRDAEGRVKLSPSLDFCLAGEVRTPSPSDRHVAPEILDSTLFGEPSCAVDLYCLGTTAIELLTGPKFDQLCTGMDDSDPTSCYPWLHWHRSQSECFPPLAELVRRVPPDLGQVIDHLVIKSVEDRIMTAQQAIEQLESGDLNAVVIPSRSATRQSSSRVGTSMPTPIGHPSQATIGIAPPQHRKKTASKTKQPTDRQTASRPLSRIVLSTCCGFMLLFTVLLITMGSGKESPGFGPQFGGLILELNPNDTIVTGEDGKPYHEDDLKELPVGEITLNFSRDGFLEQSEKFNIEPGKPKNKYVNLVRSPAVRFVLQDEAGEPIVGTVRPLHSDQVATSDQTYLLRKKASLWVVSVEGYQPTQFTLRPSDSKPVQVQQDTNQNEFSFDPTGSESFTTITVTPKAKPVKVGLVFKLPSNVESSSGEFTYEYEGITDLNDHISRTSTTTTNSFSIITVDPGRYRFYVRAKIGSQEYLAELEKEIGKQFKGDLEIELNLRRYSVHILTVPRDATVEINGKLFNKEPIEPGPHQLKISCEGYADELMDITVGPNMEPVKCELKQLPQTAVGFYSNPPGVEIRVAGANGKLLGITPFTESLPRGTHNLIIRYQGRDKSWKIEVNEVPTPYTIDAGAF